MEAIYHARERMGGRTLCGQQGTEGDTLAAWIRADLRELERWTEPEPGQQLCARCLERARLTCA